ncbi:hypothetical protein BG004_007467 [Podila humilis]|nr:hypothetical protein BG004_007467 [Podila humilis]
MNQRSSNKPNLAAASIPAAAHTPSTVATQRGGAFYDRSNIWVSQSNHVPRRLAETIILLGETYLNIFEIFLGMRNPDRRPPIDKRIADSIATSRRTMAEAVDRGERRKVAVLTGDRATELGIRAVESIKTKTGNMNVEFVYLDLGSFADIRTFAEDVARKTSVIDLLINNAGVMAVPKFTPSVEGYDVQFAINHLGHFYLTHLLLPLVKKAPKARIVMTASSAHYGTNKINYAGLKDAKGYHYVNNYCGSKLATVMFARHLAQDLRQSHPNITVNCLHPGACRTNLFKHSLLLHVLTTIGLQWILRPASRGARTITYLALSEEVESITGEYWFDERIRARNPSANDVRQQQELIEYSLAALNLKPATENASEE